MTLFVRAIRYGSRQFFKIVSPLISRLESNRFTYHGQNVPAPVFIVGAPRTGSTILYQALTNRYQLAYIDNLTCSWHQHLRFGVWLSQRKYGDAPHGNFSAEHGSTGRFGGHAPSECGAFWYRWLPMDRHFVDHDEVSDEAICEMKAEVLGVSAYLNRPMLFKNLNAGQRLRLIRRAFPDAKIIFVRRDPRFVTRSILNARKKLGVQTGQWWSIMPPNVSELTDLPEPEMCAAQVYYLEKQIDEDLAMFPRHQVREVFYQDFSEVLIGELGHWLSVPARSGAGLPAFKQDDVQELPPEELKELSRLVDQYPFKKELFV